MHTKPKVPDFFMGMFVYASRSSDMITTCQRFIFINVLVRHSSRTTSADSQLVSTASKRASPSPFQRLRSRLGPTRSASVMAAVHRQSSTRCGGAASIGFLPRTMARLMTTLCVVSDGCCLLIPSLPGRMTTSGSE